MLIWQKQSNQKFSLILHFTFNFFNKVNNLKEDEAAAYMEEIRAAAEPEEETENTETDGMGADEWTTVTIDFAKTWT